MKFLFNSYTVCKNPRFWISSNIMPQKKIEAATLAEACEKYAAEAAAVGIEISKTQRKRPTAIYIDDIDGNAQQEGFLYKATTDIYDEERGKWTKCRAEIWATIYELKSPFITE